MLSVLTDRGDVVELLDENGSPFAAYRYDAWGNPLGEGNVPGSTGVWAQATGLIGTALAAEIAQRQVLRYASYCYDSESGMYYLSSRHCDPANRQFLSKDLSRNDGEQSAYQYCLGNPIRNVDPTGYLSWNWAKKIGSGFKWFGGKVWSGLKATGRGVQWFLNPLNRGLRWFGYHCVPYVKEATEYSKTKYQEYQETGSKKAWAAAFVSSFWSEENWAATATLAAGPAAKLATSASTKIAAATTKVEAGAPVASGSIADPVSGARLASELAREEASSVFARDGTLVSAVVDDALIIKAPGSLANPVIPEGMAKYTTPLFHSPSGSFQVHFYMNPAEGVPWYGLDYKVIFPRGIGVE